MSNIHNFDDERNARHAAREAEFGEKPFRFGGEVFYARANVRYQAIKAIAEITDATEGVEVFNAVEQAVLAMLDPREDAHERFRKVCRSEEDPVTFDDIAELQNWLITEVTTRPPTPLDSSSTGPSGSGTLSTVPSSTAPEGA